MNEETQVDANPIHEAVAKAMEAADLVGGFGGASMCLFASDEDGQPQRGIVIVADPDLARAVAALVNEHTEGGER